jgi:SAM-dependent methyltransferase
MVFVSPRPSPIDIENLYTNRENFDEIISVYERIAVLKIFEYQECLEKISQVLPGKGKLLDFACGAGYFFEQAQNAGWEAHGSELGEWAKAACDARNVSNIHIGSLDELNFPEEYFDVIYAAQVFEHLREPRNELQKLSKILRSGGLLYADVPNYHTLPMIFGRDKFTWNEPPQHINYFSPNNFSKMISAVGFSIELITTSGGLNWENLLGRRVKSDILNAYDNENININNIDKDNIYQEKLCGRKESILSMTKKIIKKIIVDPIFYKKLGLGINLSVLARKQ